MKNKTIHFFFFIDHFTLFIKSLSPRTKPKVSDQGGAVAGQACY